MADQPMMTRLISLLHPIAHILAGVLAVMFCLPPEPYLIIGGALAGLLPDMDSHLGLPHRAHSHSVIVPIVIYLFYASESVKEPLLIAIIAGYTSHLIIDLCHSNGIMLLFPITRTYLSFANVEPRFISMFLIVPVIMLINNPFVNPPVKVALSTPLPPLLPTATLTRTPTPTRTPTNTPLPTGTATPNYQAAITWASYQTAIQREKNDCLIYGSNHSACKIAKEETKIFYARWCEASHAPECLQILLTALPPTYTPSNNFLTTIVTIQP